MLYAETTTTPRFLTLPDEETIKLLRFMAHQSPGTGWTNTKWGWIAKPDAETPLIVRMGFLHISTGCWLCFTTRRVSNWLRSLNDGRPRNNLAVKEYWPGSHSVIRHTPAPSSAQGIPT